MWLLLVFLSLSGVNALGEGVGGSVEQTFPLLKTRTGVYTNVTVTKMTRDWIFILHATGVCNVKAEDLPPDVRLKLGYDKPAPPEDPKAKAAAAAKASPFKPFANFKMFDVKKFAADWQHKGPQELKSKLDEMRAGNPTALYLILGIIAALHIFVSTCFWMICRKTHNSPGPLVWVPILQLIPLLRAANMPRIWFFGYFIPVINIIAQIVWSVKICKSRGKSPFVAFLLILPPTTPFAFLYLAFSRSAPIALKSPEPMCLQFT